MTRSTHWTEDDLNDYKRRRLGMAEKTRADTLTTTEADRRRESELQGLCEQELTRRGIEHLHLSPRAREKRGWPDLTFALRCLSREEDNGSVLRITKWSGVFGFPVAVELKSADGVLSEAQKGCLSRLESNGWLVRVVRDYDTFCAILDGDLAAGEQLETEQ